MRLLTEHMEFTWDMVRTLPNLYYYLSQGEEVEVHCKPNLSALYKIFTPYVKERGHRPIHAPGSYSDDPPYFAEKNWTPPPLKEMFKDTLSFADSRPIVTINNKYTTEWGFSSPVIYLDVDILDKLFTLLKPFYNIVYIRPAGPLKGYQVDHQRILELKDFELIKEKHPEVITIQDVVKNNPQLDFNSLQFALLAPSDKHIAVAGGNACVSAYFGGDLVIFNCDSCPSHNRKIWNSNSWLRLLGGSNVIGYSSYDDILDYVKENWLD